MDSVEVGRALRHIGQLMEIEGANPFKARAYRNAGEALAYSGLSLEQALAHPGAVAGLGKDTSTVAQSIVEQGLAGAVQALGITTPLSVVELTRVPGIGPKTARALYRDHHIASLIDLHAALSAGRLHNLQGFGPSRLQRLSRDLAVLLTNQHMLPIAATWPLAMDLEKTLHSMPGVAAVSVTGAFRRLVVESERIELVVALETDVAFRQWCQQWPLTQASDYVDLAIPTYSNPLSVRIYTTDRPSFAARLMRTTGDDVHQSVIEGLLGQAGYEWINDTITDEHGDALVTDTEPTIYALVGLPALPPELREAKGLLCKPDKLVKQDQIRGDLHVHSVWSDGSLTLENLVATAELLGYEYIAVTDHSQSLAIAGGLTPARLAEQRAEILRLREKTKVHILHGIEVDILTDGTLDLPDDVLWDLDLVVASVHSAMHQPAPVMTNRILQAVRHPAVDIIGHPTGRVIGRRSGYELDFPRILAEAASHDIILELNANPNRLDIFDDLLRQATAAGVVIAIDTDTHHADEFAHMSYGVRMAQRACLQTKDVCNTMPFAKLVKRLHQHRHKGRIQ